MKISKQFLRYIALAVSVFILGYLLLIVFQPIP
jgi:hypothetical protein